MDFEYFCFFKLIGFEIREMKFYQIETQNTVFFMIFFFCGSFNTATKKETLFKKTYLAWWPCEEQFRRTHSLYWHLRHFQSTRQHSFSTWIIISIDRFSFEWILANSTEQRWIFRQWLFFRIHKFFWRRQYYLKFHE